MSRRRFIQTALGTAASLRLTRLPGAQPDAQGSSPETGTPSGASIGRPPPRRGPAASFDYARLKGEARALAAGAYQAPTAHLPPALGRLSWDAWQSIRFRSEHSLWQGQGLRFQARFFHLGFTIRRPVRLFTVEDGQAREIRFDPALFDYGHSGLETAGLPADLGFAGFRLLFHTDWTRDIAAFQGASYFRAVDGDLQYGMSQRGLAIDCGLPQPEEFPDFVAYYLERPARDSSRVVVYGLLDSPSVAGAYRFTIDAEDTLAMDVDVALYPRRSIERLGIAPGTSMFLCGPNDRRYGEDWRPAIHDSDGLQLHTGAGEWLWRPLINPPDTHVNSYFDTTPRGFGLMQRDRNFSHYQDDGVFYERRPSVWVEPRGDWGRGAVMLVELHTADETADNVVAFWNPAAKPQPGEELLYAYRLFWCRYNPSLSRLAQVLVTRDGIGGVVGQKRSSFSWRFVVDFAGGDFAMLGSAATVTAVVSASRGRVELVSARPLQSVSGWRAMFDLRPDDNSPEAINLRLYLALDNQPLTETWIYQYSPPAPGERAELLRLSQT
jgi:glucans biosynthesis protein